MQARSTFDEWYYIEPLIVSETKMNYYRTYTIYMTRRYRRVHAKAGELLNDVNM